MTTLALPIWLAWSVAIGLAASGSVLAFFGAAQLLTHGFFDPVAVVPLLVGIALIITVIAIRVRGSDLAGINPVAAPAD